MTDFYTSPRLPIQGETVLAAEHWIEPGGKGYNQAIAAASLGADVSFITVVGDDEDGRRCEQYMKKTGVSGHYFIKKTGFPTARAVVINDMQGNNSVVVHRGAADQLCEADLRSLETVIAKSELLLVQMEFPVAVVQTAMEIALRSGVRVMLNPAPALKEPPDFLKKAFLLTPNESEAAALLGLTAAVTERPEAYVRRIREAGYGCMVITMGAAGALVCDSIDAYQVYAPKTEAVDTTGAGDVFNAALAVKLVEGACLEAAVSYACNAAALSVAHRHVMEAIPTRAEADKAYTAGRIGSAARPF